VKDLMTIAVAMKQCNMPSMMSNGPSPLSQLAQFIGQSFAQGKWAANDLQNLQLRRQSTTDTVTQSPIQEIFWGSSFKYVS